jgi:hypothetical protein
VLAGTTGGVAVTLTGANWQLIALAGGLSISALAVLCWVLSNTARTNRAVRLLHAIRQTGRTEDLLPPR